MDYSYPAKPPWYTTPGVFQYPKVKSSRVIDDIRRADATDLRDEGKGPARYTIQGKRAYETEWFTYQALLRAGYKPSDIQFQVGFGGGRNFKGGYIVDFIVNTQPLPTPIWVHGEYWHSGEIASQDFIKQMRLLEEGNGAFNEPIVLWGNQVTDVDMAYWHVIDALGRA